MRVLLNNEDHFRCLNECVQKQPTTVCIATYGLWAGIRADGNDSRDMGDKYRSETREFLESMRSVQNVRILVGNYEYKSCKGKCTPCGDCERGYVMGLIRHMNHVEKFPEFKWRISVASHLKCFLFSYPNGEVRGITGGRNLTDSSWSDVTVELDKMSTLIMFEQFVSIWKATKSLDAQRLNEIMLEQGISEKTLKNLIDLA